MSEDEDWIDGRCGEAKKLSPLVTDAVTTRMKTLLKGELIEQQLGAMKLEGIANALIADMATPTLLKAEASHED